MNGLSALAYMTAPAKSEEEGATYLYGYINKKGDWAIKPQFQDAWGFDDKGLASVRSADGFEYRIDKSGKPVAGELAHFTVDDQHGYKNMVNGQIVVKPSYADGHKFSEGLAAVKSGDKWGFIDATGKLAISAGYEEAWDFSEGLAPVKIGGKWGYIDAKGAVAIKPQFDDANPMSDGFASVSVGGKYAYMDKKGKMIFNPKFDRVDMPSEGLNVACNNVAGTDAAKCGYIDMTGKMVIEQKYDDGGAFHEGAAVVLSGEKYFCIDKTGKTLFQLY
jgi:hypothetical protein